MVVYPKNIFMSKFCALFLSQYLILSIRCTFFNFEELQKSKYGVEISAEPVLLNNENNDGSTMQVTSKYGQQYQCVLPVVHFNTKEPNVANVTTEDIKILLEPLNDTCLYLLNGWWSYKFCMWKSVYQYHEEAGKQVKNNISLGHFSGETNWSSVNIQEETRGDERYHSQFYSNGTVCDLTGEPRKTEVRFFCNPQGSDHISRIHESSTCVYIINLYTNKLCNHSLFQPTATPEKYSITCSPALGEEQYKKYTEAQSRKSEKIVTDEHVVMSDSDEKESEDKDNDKKPSSLGIFNYLAKMLHEEDSKETAHDHERTTKDDEVIDWDDVYKTTKNIIAKSMEQIDKLKVKKGLSQYEDDEDISEDENADDNAHEKIDEETSRSYSKTKQLKISKKLTKNTKDIESRIYDEKEGENMNREDGMGWDIDNIDDDIQDIKGPSTLFKRETSKLFYNIKKQEKDAKSEYYQQLIEHLKMQYRHFKKQLDAVVTGMNKKIKGLEDAAAVSKNPNSKVLVDTIKLSVNRLQDKQRVAEDAMKRLTDLYDVVMEDPDYLKANEELASIRSTLAGLIEKVATKSDNNGDFDESKKGKPYKPSARAEEMLKYFKGRKNRGFDMGTPKLDKVVSKLKKIMTHDNSDTMDQLEDDRISVRVTKIKEKSEDLYDDKDYDQSYVQDEELGGINESAEMKAATKKMENMVRKQLEDAGVNHEGKIKVKIITSKEALRRVAGGEEKFQILTPQETNQFRDLLSNLLGGNQEQLKEKRRQGVMEDNYNLVWNQDGFQTGNKQHSSMENEDSNENK